MVKKIFYAICAMGLSMMITSCSQDNGTGEQEETEFDLSDLYALDYDSLAEQGIYLPGTYKSDADTSLRDEDWHPEMPLTSWEDIRERNQEWIRQMYCKRGEKIHGVSNDVVKFRYSESDYLKWGQLNGRNWMEYVDDGQLICNLSIPASHDSYTFYFADGTLLQQLALTQEKNICWQFNYGIRMFDLRISEHGNLAHGMSTLYHLHEAIGEMICLAHNNPSEGIFVVISNDDDDNDKYKEQLKMQLETCCRTIEDGKMYKGRLTREEVENTFVYFRPDLRMKDIRGKICVLNREKCMKNDSELLKLYKATYIHYGDMDDGVQTGQCNTGEFRYLCQDYSSDISTALKLHEIQAALDVKTIGTGYCGRSRQYLVADDPQNLILINHLSAFCGSAGPGMSYNEAAESINAESGAGKTVKTIHGALGFMPMDFIGSEWCDPGCFSLERKTYGRRMCSYIWQHNFYQENSSLYWCMSNDQAQWHWDLMDYVYYNFISW